MFKTLRRDGLREVLELQEGCRWPTCTIWYHDGVSFLGFCSFGVKILIFALVKRFWTWCRSTRLYPAEGCALPNIWETSTDSRLTNYQTSDNQPAPQKTRWFVTLLAVIFSNRIINARQQRPVLETVMFVAAGTSDHMSTMMLNHFSGIRLVYFSCFDSFQIKASCVFNDATGNSRVSSNAKLVLMVRSDAGQSLKNSF